MPSFFLLVRSVNGAMYCCILDFFFFGRGRGGGEAGAARLRKDGVFRAAEAQDEASLRGGRVFGLDPGRGFQVFLHVRLPRQVRRTVSTGERQAIPPPARPNQTSSTILDVYVTYANHGRFAPVQ